MNNTKRFYKRGWTGVNIEPNTIKFKKITKYRKRDINLNVGISDQKGEFEFFLMSADTLSTFSKENALQSEKKRYKILKTIKIKTITLKDVFDYFYSIYPKNKIIDFISMDTEGFNIHVLKGNDWNNYRPKLICIENDKSTQECNEFLEQIRYVKIFSNNLNTLWKIKSF